MRLDPITRSSASDVVFEQLATSIVGGDVEPGDSLPSERALAEALGVSRPVVREALKRLAHAGLVAIRHGGATTVTDFRRTAGPDLLSRLLLDRHGDLDLGVARAIVEARADLGPPVAAAAARRGDPLLTADALLDRMRATDDVVELQRLSLDLWDAVVDASGNVVYRLLFNALRRAYEPVMDALAVVMRDEVSDVDGYAKVVAAVRASDPRRAAEATGAVVASGSQAAIDAIDALLADDDQEKGSP